MKRRSGRRDFVERTLSAFLSASEYASSADQIALSRGLLQQIDPRVKLPGFLLLILAVAASHRLAVIGIVFVCAVGVALLSRIPVGRLAFWVWTPVLLFTGVIAVPAVFLTPGKFLWSYGFLSITQTGLRSAAFLISRAGTAATLSALLILSTPWVHVLKALRVFRCPVVLVMILGMTYRYIFVLLATAWDMLESRKSRTVGYLPNAEARRLAASSIGVLLSKSLQLSSDVHLSMQSRGFRGEVYLLDDFQIKIYDWFWLGGFFAGAIMAFWYGR
jgi:cobalt/nickel transport system permease protein